MSNFAGRGKLTFQGLFEKKRVRVHVFTEVAKNSFWKELPKSSVSFISLLFTTGYGRYLDKVADQELSISSFYSNII